MSGTEDRPAPPWSALEFAVVVTVAFGWFTLSSLLWVLSDAPLPALSGSDLRHLVGIELCAALVLAIFLWRRGWRWHHLARPWQRRDLFTGACLAAAALIAYWILAAGVDLVDPGILASAPTAMHDVRALDVIATCVINSIYEEVFVCAYVIAAMRGVRSPWFAIHASVALRLGYHLYQGIDGVINIIPMGMLFALWYARSGRLWPLVIAHALLNLLHFLGSAAG